MNKKNLSTLYILALCGAMIFCGLVTLKKDIDYQQLKTEAGYYQRTHLQKSGYSQGWGNYDLRSLDGGINWYAVASTNGGVVILGSADQVYPGLVEHILAMGRLYSYVESNGPVVVGTTISSAQSNLLERAGFVITNKP